MSVGLKPPTRLLPVAGIRLAQHAAGIKSSGASDMLLLEACEGTVAAGVFTQNAYCAAPVQLCRAHLAGTSLCRALLINSGNANAGTGRLGEANAKSLCADVAKLFGVPMNQVLPFSTGVIGLQLPLEGMQQALPQLLNDLAEDHWLAAAEAIMTTDTIAKGCSETCVVDGQPVTITGISKGSGMIHPNMATMLAYIATDAAVDPEALQAALTPIANRSFNCITVDGDTSTNDSFVALATGCAANKSLTPAHQDWQAFVVAFERVAVQLAHAIVRDGEGATRFIEINVSGAASEADCRVVGLTIAHSPLVKTAFFAGDPNLGRILAAIGRAPVAGIQMDGVSLTLGGLPVVVNGEPAADYDEARAMEIMAAQDIVVQVELGTSDYHATVWTTDLSYDYVKINAEYRS